MHNISALLLLLLLSPTLYSQSRDYWLKTERKGTAYANQHIVVTKLPDGNLRYESAEHVRADVIGTNPQDIFLDATYVVDADLRPVSFESTSKSPVRQSHSTAIRSANRLNVTVETVGEPSVQRTIDMEGAYFDAVLPDLIARRVAEKQFRLKLLGANDSKPNWADVEVGNTTDTEISAVVRGTHVTARFRISRTGQILEQEMQELRTRTYATDASDAQNITYLNTADGLNLMVRGRKPVPNLYRVPRAQVQVRWKNIPFTEFRLEDNRQRVVRKDQAGDQYEVVLEISTPSEPTPGSAHPPSDISRRYLGDDEYIKPQDQAIRKQAALIAAGSPEPDSKVRKLLEWVHANVETDLIAETLTGPEVLAQKRGKCSENAILFASLARAEGIPTRIALGVTYGTAWVGHMWNEVWLGEWIAVDATLGGFVSSPSHLKFIDSPTIDGVLGVRLKLVDNLEIEILDFDPGKAPKSLKTGITGPTYTNAAFTCKISAPDDSWALTDDGAGVLKMDPSKGEARFAMVLFPAPPGTQAQKVLERRLAVVATTVPNYKLIESGATKIAGRSVPRAVFSQTNHSGKTLINTNILLIDGVSAYLFAWIVPQEEAAATDTVLNRILDSFELIH